MSCDGIHGTNTNKTLKKIWVQKETNIWVQIKNEKKIGTN